MNTLYNPARFAAFCTAILSATCIALPQVPAESATLIRLSAEQGDAAAQDHLAHLYEKGQGVQQDLTEAARWYRKAAEQGSADAQYNLGLLYDRGYSALSKDFVAVDNGKELKQGSAAAATVGQLPRDYAEAASWYLKAAEQGQVNAQSNLGLMYAEGRGVPRNYVEAVRWYTKAAEQGDAGAQGNLAIMYQLGRGVVRDQAAAIRWYRKAADQGEPNAQYNLGRMYERGQGVPLDLVQAYFWLDLGVSRSRGDAQRKFAAERDSLGEKMTDEQIAAAQRQSHDWKPTVK
jgi:TPR repeat protein